MSDWFPKQTVGDLINQAAARHGPREALMHQGRRWTFAEFRAETDRVARALIGLGIGPGDKVSVWMPNRAEWLFLFGAIAKIGAVIVPVNTRFRTGDMEYLVNHSDSAALVLMDQSGPVDYLTMLREVAPEIDGGKPDALHPAAFPALRNVIVIGAEQAASAIARGVIDWDALLAGAGEVPVVRTGPAGAGRPSRRHLSADVHQRHYRLPQRRNALPQPHPHHHRRRQPDGDVRAGCHPDVPAPVPTASASTKGR